MPHQPSRLLTAAAMPNDATQQLLQRVNELEAKVKQLEANQAAPAPPPPPAPAPTPEAASEMPTVHVLGCAVAVAIDRFYGDLGYQCTGIRPQHA